MTEGLRNCPFCGGEVMLGGSENVNGSPWYYCVCIGCGASTAGAPTKEEAIENWNRRAEAQTKQDCDCISRMEEAYAHGYSDAECDFYKRQETQVDPSLTQDCVKRQAVIDTVYTMVGVVDTGDIMDFRDTLVECFKVLPSAEPERKKGKWVFPYGDRRYKKCSRCGKTYYSIPTTSNYCPNCGADMRGEQDV